MRRGETGKVSLKSKNTKLLNVEFTKVGQNTGFKFDLYSRPVILCLVP